MPTSFSVRGPALAACLVFAAIPIGCGGESHLTAADGGSESGSTSGGSSGAASGGSSGSSGGSTSSGSASGGSSGSGSGGGSSGSSSGGVVIEAGPPLGPDCAAGSAVGSGCTMPGGMQGVCTACGTCVDFFAVNGNLTCSVPSCAGAPQGSACVLSSGSPGTCCAGGCADLLGADKNNCGACGQVCPGTSECTNGTCTMICTSTAGPTACPAGFTCVGGSYCALTTCVGAADGQSCTDENADYVCCGGVCVNPSIDANNCGACGIKCGSSPCVAATVFENGGYAPLSVCLPEPSDAGAGCLVQGGCPDGEECIGHYCVTQLCNAAAPPTAYCAAPDGHVGVCVDTTGVPPFPCEDNPM